MITRESLKEYVRTFRDAETQKTLIETLALFDGKLDALIEKANSDLIISKYIPLINEYFVFRELLSMRMKEDMKNIKETLAELKRDVGYNER